MKAYFNALLGLLGRAPQLAHYLDVTKHLGRDIYSILPAVVIAIVTPIYLSAAFRNPRKPMPGRLLWTKIATVACLLLVDMDNIAHFCHSPAIRSRATVAGAVASGISSLCLALLLYAEKMFSFRPPAFLSLALVVTILFDVTKTSSYLDSPDLQTASHLSTAMFMLKSFLLLTEEVAKALAIRRLQPKPPRRRNFLFRNMSLWLNATLILGFRNIIKINDLLDMGPRFNSETLYQHFKPVWEKASKKGDHALAKTCVRALPWDFGIVFIPQVFLIGFTLMQPPLVRMTVAKVTEGSLTKDDVSYLIRSALIVYVGMALSRTTYEHLNFRMATLVRGTLISAIYDKTLHLSHDQLKNSAAVTLMSTDINGVEAALIRLHEIWGRFMELGLGLSILYSIIGPAALIILVPVVVLATTTIFIAKQIGVVRREWNEKIEERVSATSYILTQLKSIKISGFAPLMSDYLNKKRLSEILISRKERTLRVMLHTSQHFIECMTPVIVVAGGLFWTRNTERLTVADIFNTLTIIAIIAVPLARAIVNIPAFVSALVCITRIQEFLLLENHVVPATTEDHDAKPPNRKGKAPQRRVRQVQLAVELDNATITLPGKDSPLLRNIKLAIRQGQIGMIYGPVGCGKSSLLRVILGELEASRGFVGVDRRKVAYCDQEAWLQNHSIRDNIIAQNEHNPMRYKLVIHACALEEDLAQLPAGDLTLVGSAGNALSGGQRQRVALARALYHDAQLVVLDDVLSALDATTARTILYRLLGKRGVLRQFSCSVVMTTNILEDLSAADVIYTITADGEVRKAASINQLIKDAFAKQSEKERAAKPPPDPTRLVQSEGTPVPDNPYLSERHDDDTVRQKGDLSLYGYYLRTMQWYRLVIFFFLTVMTGLSCRMPLMFVKYWIDKEIAPDDPRYFTSFTVISASSVFLMTLMVAVYYLILAPAASINMHEALVKTVMRITLPFISVTDASSILTRFSQDMTMIAQLLPVSLIEVVYISLQAIIMICIVSSAASYSLATIPAFGLLLYLIQFFYLRTSRQLRMLDMEAKVPLFKHFSETAAGIEHIRAFKWQENFLWLNYGMLDYSQKPHYYFFCTRRWLSLVLDLWTCTLAVTTVTLALHGESSQTAIGLAMVNLVSLSKVLTDAMESWVDLETCLGAVARTRDFNTTSPLERSRRTRRLPDHWPTAGKIEFRDVTANYNLDATGNKPVLRNVSIKIKAREKVAIIGRTGSGKSSLILSLLNLLDHTGKIFIDGKNIKNIPVDFLRDRITTIPQDGVELDASVRVNLDPYDDPESTHRLADETLQENLTLVGLWDIIEKRGGLDVPLSDMKLSPGQKQLLCLGRAVLCREYKQSRIVLIDEGTSSVDVETDKRIQAILASEFAGCTVITITHRHHGVEHSDTVLEMRDGRITHSLNRKTKLVTKLVE